ncbi:SGNH/GDSL hydrolase family protein [Dyadobacter sp. CY312]|uniref:SGNH/GDSL hydrolase family protein n=1 Tax=Dyadobacter sp. CY312 TaxID=2907303 RepID=UPI001F17E8F1|nr:SGNH/GDSL hydrolase family protein [Dyadobacter sp. CY312]MCE7040719.1 SGNH/GDSL hydrolase family protein [Dyadobacter sp. CY312]
MKIKIFIFFVLFVFVKNQSFSQSAVLKWRNPENEAQNVVEGRAWSKEVKNPYDRFPARAEKDVRKQVWDLSRQSAGLMIRFRSNAEQIKIRYTVGGNHALPHMPATGVSGVDLYAVSSDGDELWCAGKYAFKDTISYDFQNLNPNDQYHKHGREYRLFLPLYNSVKWLEVGVPEGTEFKFLPIRPEKPIVAYGTSIMQGACASRPGMAWTSILSRKMDRPLINLGFSGNGRLEKEVTDLVAEVEASVYILDCLPNLTIRTDSVYSMTATEVAKRIKDAVRTLKNKHTDTPIALAGHPGCTDGAINPKRLSYCQEANKVLTETFAELKAEGIQGIYLIPSDDFQQGIETMVDGTHPTDLGMMLYAQGYEKHLRKILHEEAGTMMTTRPRTQLRELNNYDWETRHRDILELNSKTPPKTVVIGNSITHFWGGLPKGPRAVGETSWSDTFGKNKVLNAGYGWDRIENVLWRIYSGELDGFTANQIFVNIGTNNLQHNTDEQIVEGWELLINAIKQRQPTAGLYMIGIYPRRNQEERVTKINLQLAKLCGSLNIHYINPGKVFLKSDGKIDEGMFSDGLHPNEKGYTKLGAAIKPYVK